HRRAHVHGRAPGQRRHAQPALHLDRLADHRAARPVLPVPADPRPAARRHLARHRARPPPACEPQRRAVPAGPVVADRGGHRAGEDVNPAALPCPGQGRQRGPETTGRQAAASAPIPTAGQAGTLRVKRERARSAVCADAHARPTAGQRREDPRCVPSPNLVVGHGVPARPAAARALPSPCPASPSASIRFRAANRASSLAMEGRTMFETLLQDLRYAVRTLRARPGFTLIAVVTLGLGLGASLVMFSAVNRVLLEPLPFRDGDRIVFARLQEPTAGATVNPSAALARAWLNDARSFEALEAIATRRGLLRGPDGAQVISRSEITPGFLAFLGLTPVLGRMFSAEDDAVVLLGHGLWRREFGGSRDVIGQTIELDDGAHTIIGVMPQRLDLYEASDVWGPLGLDAASDTTPRSIGVVGRLRPGVTRAAAEHELQEIAARTPQPPIFAFLSDLTPRIERPRDVVDDDVRAALLVLFAAVGLVLLIACVNVAQLLRSRGAGRGRELAIRAALGAGRRRLIRQLLVESLLLALAGGALGLFVAWWGVDALARLRPQTFADLGRLGIDARVLAFGLALSTGTGVLFGLFPALAVTDLRIADTLRGGWAVHGAASGPRGRGRARSGLIAAEMALSVVLLVSAGLLARSLLEMQRAESGFHRPEELLVVRVALPVVGSAPDPNALAPYMTFADQVLARVRALPGVAGATWAEDAPPFYSLPNGRLEVDGSDAPGAA